MAENRVVIKINYDADKRKEVIDPKIVTVWHTGRILAAFVVVLLIIGMLVWILAGDEQQEKIHAPPEVNLVNDFSQSSAQTRQDEKSVVPNPSPVAQVIHGAVINKAQAIIYDRRVIRASLNINIKDNEPDQGLSSSLILDPGKSQELFYFSETRPGNDAALFHRWLKDDRQVHKKATLKQKAKFISKHIITAKDIGHWKVELIDRKGKIYSQVAFGVELR